MTDPIIDRLTAWRPGMREYHSGPEISSGFLRDVAEEGLSVALARRAAGSGLTTDKRMGRGGWLHAMFSGDTSARFSIAPGRVQVRRGKLWDAAVAHGHKAGCEAVLLVSDVLDCWSAWRSLWAPAPEWPSVQTGLLRLAQHAVAQDDEARDRIVAWCQERAEIRESPAKRQIRAILRRWAPRAAEVSHRWEPDDVPGCPCRIREDLVARSPSETWAAIQLKTTEVPLHRFARKRELLRSLAFYREGHRDLFGEGFLHLLAVVRFPKTGERKGWPYPWGLYNVGERREDLDRAWTETLYGHGEWGQAPVPGLIEIHETLSRGESHGPEEKGIQL